MDNFEQSERSYVIALRELNGCLVGYWNGARKYFSTLLPSQYTLRGAKSVCTKTVYPMLSDSPLERYRTVSIESSCLHAEECQNRRSLVPQIRLQPEETKIILLYAMRYCLGRSSYAVGEMCDLIRFKWPALPPDTRSLLIVDLRSEVKSDRPLGMKMDRREWESLLDFMESSFEPQPTDKTND